MKVFTKYLLTLLLLGIASVVNAQESEALLADGTYYIKNVASGNFFTGANNWGTQASVAPSGAPFEVTLLPEGGYSLKYLLSTVDNTHLGSNLYVDSQTPDGGFAIEKNEDDTFVIKLDGKYLAEGTETGPTNDAIVVQTEELTAAAKWQFITIDEAVAAMKQTAPANATFLISNPNFNRNTSTAAWTVSADCTNRNLGGGGTGNFCAESYHSTFTISQVLANAPAGRYMMTAQGFYRQDDDLNEDAPVFFANDKSVAIPVKTGSENSMTDASNSFTAGAYTIEPFEFTVFEDGQLTIGVKGTSTSQWVIWDNFQLTYLSSEVPADEFEPAYQNALAAAIDALENEDYSVVDGIERENLENAINIYSEVEGSQAAYEEAIKALVAATNAYVAAAPAYLAFGEAQAQLAACQIMYPYASEEKLAAAKQVGLITIENAEQAEEMAVRLLMLCRQVAESSALLEGVEGSHVLTELIQNPNAEYGTDGWEFILEDGTSGRVDILSNEPLTDGDGNSDYRYFDGINWSSDYWNGSLQQMITLPAGRYLLTVSGRASSDVMMSVFAGEDNEEMIFGEGATGGLYGRGWNDVSVEFELDEASNIYIGVRGEASTIHQWMSFTRFRLAQFEGDAVPVEDDPELEAPEGWTNLIANGNLAGDNVESFISKEWPSEEMVGARIVDGAGFNGSRGILVSTPDETDFGDAQSWDSQFWINLNKALPAGTILHVEFDYAASDYSWASTQAHGEPSVYQHWVCLGNVEFAQEWQHFSTDIEVSEEMAKGGNGDGIGLKSIAFMLNEDKNAVDYYFDNFGVWAQLPNVVKIPSVVFTYPEASSFNVDGGTMEFHVNFDMPVDAEQIHATLDNEELTVIADGSIVWLARQGDVEDMTDGEHTIKLYSIYAEGWEDEDAYTNYEFSFVVGPINLDPEAKAEVILADNLWDATEEGGIPEGYLVNFNGEERNSESQYSSGARMFVFAEGGDFTHGLYFREGYTQYGGYEDYPLYLEAGKKYTINFKSAMWKDSGTTMNFQILSADEDYLVYEEVIKNNPNVNGSKAAVTDATNTTIAFTPQEDGNYILRWAVDGFNEVLLANPTVKYMTDDVNENVLAFFAALENAKQVRDANADFTNNGEYANLDDVINWYESEYKYFNNFDQFLEAAKDLENVAYYMKEYRRLYQEYYPLAETMLALRQQYADTKFTQSYIYNYYLIRCIDNYAPYGEILDQYNLGSLSNAYSDIKYAVNMVQDMFTEGPSQVTMTGYAVLKERVRQGAETMRTLGIDNEDLLWDAENILDEEEWLVDEMKQSIKKDIYKKLSKADNTLFDPIIDEATLEEITPAYNMNIFVENPNIYKWGYSDKDFSVPGWYVENANVSTGWVNYDSWEVPADAMFSNWGNFFEVAQSIGDLPAGTYTVKFAVGERQEDTYTDSKAYVYTGNEEYYADIDYIGQTFPEFSVNNGIVTIENVVVTDGWMQFGVLAESGSHLFFNEVQLLLTAPAPGYDYYDESEVLVGDVNLDGEVTTSDAVATVGLVLDDWQPSYRQFRAADVNYSYNITVSDVVGVVNIALNGYEWYRALARSQSMEQEINYLTQDANKIGLNNTTEFVAFQMDVTLADGAMLNGVNLNQRANGLNIRYSHLEGNTYRIMAFSMNMAAITGNEGELLSLDITGNQTVTLSNIEFTDTAARAYALGVNDATGINGIMAGDANADYYTVDGVKSNKMRKGMNVVKTADGKVRKMFVK
ncbi:hypothetical protein [uncultured Prevotella sp.]|uniref:hypothetical protein n=1 Tax=uncultured Prevotella sp. TaxID=159272 RepID=UPI0025D12696|nr:hypothetical protein [uncultured Prevotella sp.]